MTERPNPKWAEEAAQEWFETAEWDDDTGSPSYRERHVGKHGFLAGIQCLLDRIEKTREKDDVGAVKDHPSFGKRLESDWNEGRESVRKEILGDD
jgi:hypothetical protein